MGVFRLFRLPHGLFVKTAHGALKRGFHTDDSCAAMPPRRPSSTHTPAATGVSALQLALRCKRLESLLATTLKSRSHARAELAQTRARLRTVGDDFVVAFEAIDARTDAAVIAAELRGLLGYDLDIETALNVTTELLTSRFRPANAAVWLCNSRGDHAVAAYSASNISRSRVESSLGIIGREVCPQLGCEPVAQVFENALDMISTPPPGGGALAGKRAIIAPIVYRGERFGAVLLLQDQSAPWPSNCGEITAAICSVVAEQIDRITRIVVQRNNQWPKDPPPSAD